MHYLLTYSVAEDYLERRDEFRKEHLELAKAAHAAGDLVMAGATYDPDTEGVTGAVLHFECDSVEPIKNFAESDPYVRHGLVTEYTIHIWNAVVGEGTITPDV